MKVEAIDPVTNDHFKAEISDEQAEQLNVLTKERITDSKLDLYIDSLEISADAKALIHDIKKATIKVGQQIIKVGKRLIEMVLAIVNQFPNLTFGFILGLLLGSLIGAIPILGVVFGPILTPLLAAMGIITGMREDLKDKALSRKIKEAMALYEPLRGSS